MEAYVGHAPGGVCPFGVNEGVAVYLDEEPRAGWMSARNRKANKALYNKRKGSSARTFVRDRAPFFSFIEKP